MQQLTAAVTWGDSGARIRSWKGQVAGNKLLQGYTPEMATAQVGSKG
jgi:hypothetical protein